MRFSVKKIEVAAFAVFFALFCALGIWQLQRANEKRDIENRINARGIAPALILDGSNFPDETKDPAANELEYQNIEVTGEFLPFGQLLIDNIIRNSKPGYDVMSVLKISGTEQTILVNRGWVAQGRSRTQFPEVEFPDGLQKLNGIIRTPSALPFVDASMTPLSMQAPFSLWLYADLEKYRRESGLQLLPFAMLQNSDNGDGLLRDWPVYRAKVAMHIAYAIQWFAFAIIVSIILAGVGRKRGRKAAKTDVEIE